MKLCANCKKPLLDESNEFGDIREPVCQSCFLDPSFYPPSEAEELKTLNKELSRVDEELDLVEDQLSDLVATRLTIETRIELIRSGICGNDILQAKLSAWCNLVEKKS